MTTKVTVCASCDLDLHPGARHPDTRACIEALKSRLAVFPAEIQVARAKEEVYAMERARDARWLRWQRLAYEGNSDAADTALEAHRRAMRAKSHYDLDMLDKASGYEDEGSFWW